MSPNSRGASKLFDLLYLGLAALLLPYFIYRRFKGKKSAPWSTKMGRVPERKSGVRRIWIHAVSVGEATAAEPLVKALKATLPDADIVVSTTTVTGHAVAEKRYGAENVVFYPHDFSWTVRRFLDRIKPSIVVLMELEVWPNMTAEAVARDIPVLVVNGRITERSAKRYKLGWRLVSGAFLRATRWLVQTDEYAARLKNLGVDPARIEVAGNIKYDAVDTAPPDPAQRIALRHELGIDENAPVLIGGSTHPSEEAALLGAYKKLRAGTCPSLRLILVPRHPERFDGVEAEINAAGETCVRRSTTRVSNLAAPVILVDTMGELKRMYSAADVAFVGGSLIPHGGQNVMEPCGMGVPVCHGPHMHNFNDAMEILRACKGSVELSGGDIAPALERLFTHRDEALAMAARARGGFLKKQGATARAVETIRELARE